MKLYDIIFVTDENMPGDYFNYKLEWGCPNGTKYPQRQLIQTPQVIRLKSFNLTAQFYLTPRVYRQTDRVISGYPPPLTSLRGYKKGKKTYCYYNYQF